MSNSIKKNTVYNTLKTIFSIVYPLITFPYISRILTAENVGKISFSNSIISYFSIISSLGISTYAIRECSKVKDSKKDFEMIASTIISINILSTVIAYVALIITLLCARKLDEYRLLICIQSSNILFTTLGADWVNTAMEDFKFIAIRTIGMQVLSLVLLFIFVRKPEHYIAYAIISVLASSGANILNIAYRRKFCRLKFTLKMNLQKHLTPIMLLFSMILSQTIYCNSDITMLGLMKGDYEVGLYSTSVKIYNLVNQVIASIAWVVLPQLSLGFKNNDYKSVNSVLRYSLSFIITWGLPCLVGLFVIAEPIIGTVGGDEYLSASVSLRILTLALGCSFIGGWVGNMMMIPAGRENICLKTGIISALLNVFLNLFIIPIFGKNGAAFTTFVAELVGVLIGVHYVDKKIKIINFWDIFKAPLIGSLLIIMIGYAVSKTLSSYVMITLITICLSMITYIIVLILFKNELFLSYIRPLINRIKGR